MALVLIFLTKIKTSDVFKALNCIYIINKCAQNKWCKNGEKIYNIAKAVRFGYKINHKRLIRQLQKMEESK